MIEQEGSSMLKSGFGQKPLVRSFDLFDTLIARRCIDPKEIFPIVEKRQKIRGFAQARISAEAQLRKIVYTFDDIYARLAAILPANAELLDELKTAELAVERENIFPICETLDMVQAGDIVVSDMYLPYVFLRSIMDQYRQLRNIPLILTCCGKESGWIWESLREKVTLIEHFGDNLNSDIRSAKLHGIPAVHVVTSRLTAEEKVLFDGGLPGLARIMREARLSSFNVSPNLRALQLVQVQANFPMLFIATLILHRIAVSNNYERILMSSRDCYLWSTLQTRLQKHLGGNYQVTYFLTSRLARAFPTAEYLQYTEEFLRVPACIVDMCGTGWSLKRLLAKSSAPQTPILLFYKYQNVDRLKQFYQSLGSADTDAGISHFMTGDPHYGTIERANFADHPMLSTMTRVNGNWCPVFVNPTGLSWSQVPEISVQHAIFSSMCEMISEADLALDTDLSTAKAGELLQFCYERLISYYQLYKFADAFMTPEELNTHAILRHQARKEASERPML